MPSQLLAPLFGSPAMEAVWSDEAAVVAMVAFETALAAAQAEAGIVPPTAAAAIAATDPAALDVAALAEAAGVAGNTAIPLVKMLTALVTTADPDAAKWVHYGATSQDAMDTGLVLQLREAFKVIEADLARAMAAAATLARAHRDTPMAGRTWLQQALPITFGLKMAGTLDALMRHRDRLAEARPRILSLQFGGAAGTLASLGDKGPEVARLLAGRLNLSLPDTPWHGQRDRILEAASLMAGLVATSAKAARDVALMMQTEIGEVLEPAAPGRGGSSTMPHKRNPALSATILGAAGLAPQLLATIAAGGAGEHERFAGGWQSEWLALPELARLTGGVVAKLAELLEGLEVKPERMAANLAATRGLLMAEAVQMALAPDLGRLVAHDRIEAACRTAVAEGRDLIDVLAEDPQITAHAGRDRLAALLDPAHYLGAAGTFVDRVLARYAGIGRD
ncbi:3-carboxy-cis,cis-muconate cycloisomerase [Phreatobacter oligotrophus]|uniref:3-carboxy-cis,cis-muconate cycloisomerase n=1 Tax=Phreatobacter oligotrophus TaxID=1122261 RepID=A0A2T4ZHP5_9HYPH|nr:3-carboxy-cis,cis-muconate cycloisomerase [Phreatobacter oligotrophus]PTM61497.1 3-carboxy-cis,cis-muconate cycloisomerase [Phreatobacter oligotrophus]